MTLTSPLRLEDCLEWRPLAWAPAASTALDLAHPLLVPGARILEVGYFSGMMSCYLAATFGVHVTGYEVDPSSPTRARRNAEQYGLAALTDFRAGPAESVFEIQGPFDAVFMKSMLAQVTTSEEYDRWLCWVHSVLRQGGALIALENGRGGWLTRLYRHVLSPKAYRNNCLIDHKRLEAYRRVFPLVEARYFGRVSQFLTGLPWLFRATVAIENRLCPPTEDANFVTAIVAFKG